jgi:AAA family ATP:ADP antiporter
MRIVDLRPGEGRTTWSAFATLLGIAAAHTLLETGRDALFLTHLPVERLPFLYLAIAAVGLALTRAKPRGAPGPFMVTQALAGAGVVTFAFWVASAWSESPALLYALYLWSGLFASWVVLRFWLVLGETFTVDRAKRLYGFVGAGSVLGALLGASLARALAMHLAPRHLLLASAGALVLTAVGPSVVLASTKPPGDAAAPQAKPKTGAPPLANAGLAADLRLVQESPFLSRILALVLVSTVTVTLADYLFKSIVAARVPAAELGATFASVAIATNAIALFTQLVLVGFVLRTFGVHRALWVMPALLLFASSGLLVTGGLLAALLLKGVDGSLRHSLHRTSTELLYVPLGDRERARAKPFIDLVAQRGGQAVASLAILALVSLGFGSRTLAAVATVLAGLWMVVARAVHKPYLDLFRATLREGKLDYRGELPVLDLDALETLFAALSSPKDIEVVAAIDLLEAQGRQRVLPPFLLYHPSRVVVLRLLDGFRRERRTDFLPIAERLLASDDGAVRAAAVRARAAAVLDVAWLRARLEDAAAEVRATALVCLVSAGAIADDEAERALDVLARDPDPGVRVALATAIGEEATQKFDRTLVHLADTEDADQGVAVAKAMGSIKSPYFLAPLTRMLSHRQLVFAAREALAAYGEDGLAFLAAKLEEPGVPAELREVLPRAFVSFEPALAAPVVARLLAAEAGGVVRFRLLRALSKLHVRDESIAVPRELLQRIGGEAVTSALRSIDFRMSIERAKAEDPKRATAALDLMQAMLRDKEVHATHRAFLVLGLLERRQNFEHVYRGLQHKHPKTRASSRELVENLADPKLQKPVLALIDDLPDERRLEAAASFYAPARHGYVEVLRAMLTHGDPNIVSLVRYHATKVHLHLDATEVAPTDDAALSPFSVGVATARRLAEG